MTRSKFSLVRRRVRLPTKWLFAPHTRRSENGAAAVQERLIVSRRHMKNPDAGLRNIV
jgi:hypothetical protein